MVYLVNWSEQLRVAPVVEVSREQEAELATGRVRRTSARLAQRARIVLLAAQGLQNKEIAEQLGIGRVQVARWRERYMESGLGGIECDLPRGAPPVKVDVQKLVERPRKVRRKRPRTGARARWQPNWASAPAP